jgi:hypothetical protein
MNTRIIVTITFSIFISACVFAQNAEYTKYIAEANELYNKKDYQKSGEAYTKAFVAFGNKGTQEDRYNAACTWSLAGNADSAFFQLFRLATKVNWSNLSQLSIDPDLNNIHKDKRWDELVTLVKQNKEKAEINLNKPLATILDTVMIDDQKGRQDIDNIEAKYGRDSKEIKKLWKTIAIKDSINLIKVTQILDKYGWLGADKIGANGNTALFLVIQHADIKVQEKYLPMMREAAKNGDAQPSSLALLEDRVALRKGKKQFYGSQIGRFESGEFYVQPLEDPDKVDKWREDVGLRPLNEYTQHWHFNWDPASYKKQLPKIVKREAEMRKKNKE